MGVTNKDTWSLAHVSLLSARIFADWEKNTNEETKRYLTDSRVKPTADRYPAVDTKVRKSYTRVLEVGMKKDKVVNNVIQVLTQLQRDSGRKSVAILGSTCPIGDLDQFDSLNGVEATVAIADELGVELPGVSVFVNESGTRALTVSEIADVVCKATSGDSENE